MWNIKRLIASKSGAADVNALMIIMLIVVVIFITQGWIAKIIAFIFNL